MICILSTTIPKSPPRRKSKSLVRASCYLIVTRAFGRSNSGRQVLQSALSQVADATFGDPKLTRTRLLGRLVDGRGYINSYANKRTAQGSVAPDELGRASASKFRRMPMRPAPTETAPRVAEGLRVFCRYRRERGWDNVPKTTARRPDNMLSGFRIRRASLVQRAILARYPLTAFSCGIWERSFAPRRGAVLVGGRAFLRPLNTGVTGILLKA